MGQQGDIWNTLKMLTVSDPTHMGSVLTVSETTEPSPHPILTMETEAQSCPELPRAAQNGVGTLLCMWSPVLSRYNYTG